MPTDSSDEKSTPTSLIADRKSLFEGVKSVSVAGLIFIYMSAVVFAAICYLLFDLSRHAPEKMTYMNYIPEIILSTIAIFSALLGVGMVKAGGLSTSAPNAVINPIEWEAIRDQVKSGEEEAITQYIRLTSLSGFTGTFTKLGLQGLPLATIGMTILFSILFFIREEFMDLAKLTLGAFIGSFVQKQVGASAQGGGTVKLPSGQTVKVSPPPSSVA